MPFADDEEFLRKLREAFDIEAREHLLALSSGLLELEEKPGPQRQPEIVETIFREAHSLKGAARSVNRDDIEAVCQSMESIFFAWKNEGVGASPTAFDLLSRAVDFMETRLGFATTPPATNEAVELVVRLRSLAGPADAKAEPAPRLEAAAHATAMPATETQASAETVRISMAAMDSLLIQAEEMIAVKNAVDQRAGDLAGISRLLQSWQREWGKAAAEIRRLRTTGDGNGANSPRTRLIDFLEWNHSYISSLEGRVAAVEKNAANDRRFVGGMVDDLLEEAKRLVMLPFSNLLDIFPKQVRDLARSEGKEVELIIKGREVAIDKRILEWMKDPLTHLVRNAVGHGIEKPEARRALKKLERATLSISVSQVDASHVEIIVADDGRGIDVAEVKAAAVRTGAISAEDAAERSDERAMSLIFQSGVSTSAIVTEISGRGLGMAIVREKAEKLGGSVTVTTELGRGTSFRIDMPVTLATFKGLLIRVAGQEFIVPFANVERVVRLPRSEIRSVENKETIAWAGKAISAARLDAVLGLPRIAEAGEQPFIQAVILAAGETRIAFIIDEIVSELEVLVKPLRRPLVRIRNIAAATVLGSGKAVLILNVPDLLDSATTGSAVAPQAAGKPGVKTQSILVTDDSVTSRMLLKNILSSAGYQVKTAIDGVDAITMLRTQHFDLVVSDVQMPRMDGFDLTARIRADKRLAELPVVLVTAMEAREDREHGIDVGASAYIVKSSFDQTNLLEVIRRLI